MSDGGYSPSILFSILIVGVQIFMAFNGGATSATIDSIEKGDASWGPAGIGFLGAMDKIGMTASSPLCGYLFQCASAKKLLVVSLFVNASACLIFGSLRDHYWMFAAKLLIGVTEGLQWVWAPQWISSWAPEKDKQTWMNLNSSIVAGVGAGLGIVVAGLGTANGMSYEFAFKTESGALFVFWLFMLTVGGQYLSIQPDTAGAKVSPSTSYEIVEDNGNPNEKKTLQQQMGELWQNKLFCRSAIAFSFVNFTIAGLQFLWVRFFMRMFDVDKTSAVFGQLIIVAAGGGAGVAYSSTVQFTDTPFGKQRLLFATKAFLLALLGAFIAGSGAILQLCSHYDSPLFPHQFKNATFTLYLVYAGVFITCAGVNMTPGILQIICMETVDINQTRTFGTGVYQGFNNFLGLAMGPFIPQIFMSFVVSSYHLEGQGSEDPLASLCAGFICALCGVLVSLLSSALAWQAASDEP